jgi:AcrR family transcriptional regulator
MTVAPGGRVGRPRSEEARIAVLHAVDDLLVDVGYAAMTMKGIAERAGVGRQTVYRWWSTKAEILFEASAADAQHELSVDPTGSPLDDVTAYLDALVRFLSRSPAGIAYRALLGEAQHDSSVAKLLASKDILRDPTLTVLSRALDGDLDPDEADVATALLVGPAVFWVISGRDPARLDTGRLARGFLRQVVAAPPPERE